MKVNIKIVLIAILFGAFFWGMDAVLDHYLCVVNSYCEYHLLGIPIKGILTFLEIFIYLLLYGLWMEKRIPENGRMPLKLAKQKRDLGERVRELNYLYGIPNLNNSSVVSMDEILQTAVYMIAYSWQYSENTCVRIVLRDKVFSSDDCEKTPWGHSSRIIVGGEDVGEIEVFYLQEYIEGDEKISQKEDQFLVDTIAAQLGKIIEGVWTEEAIQRQIEYLEAFNRSLQFFQSNLENIENVREGVCWLAIELFNIKMAWLGLVEEGKSTLQLAASSGFEEEQMEFIQSNWHRGAAGRKLVRRVFKSGTPIVMAHILNDPDCACWRESAESLHFQSFAILPLIGGNREIGVLNLYHEEPAFFDEELIPLLKLFADQASVALSNAMLMELIKAKRELLQKLSHQLVEAQESERQTLALELQEKIGQILTGVKLTMGAIEVQSETAQKNLDNAKMQISDLIALLRDMSQDLRPTMLDGSGLLSVLLWFFGRFNAQTGVNIEFKHHDIDRSFPPDKEITLYRVIQGLLTGLARDDDVKEVEIEVWYEDDILKFEMENQVNRCNGNQEPNYSLIEMTERMNVSGGKLSVSAPTETSCLIAGELPVKGKYINRRKRKRY
ncbi:MAG: GAF domain-containing protein [Anaerolineales bacterium]